MEKIKYILSVVLFGACLYPCVAFSEDAVPQEWLIWLEDLKTQMLQRGISKSTIEKAYGNETYYHKAPQVVQKDKEQAEFILTSRDYINRQIKPARIEKARKYYNELKKQYPKLETEYGVPLNYLVAFWAVETNFGGNKGKYHIIDGLTNLSYKNRRASFFKNELYNVLKIMENNDLSGDKMMGSWAGAMGHFQFMPSTYNAYAIDYDGDGRADVWDSFDDAIASAANYLHSLGWKTNEPWGGAVSLPWNFNYTDTGLKNTKTVAEWKAIGVRKSNGKALSWPNNLQGSIIIPDGRKGAAYMVFGNFKRIMIWNRSESYALTIGLLADYIKNNQPYSPIKSEQQYVLTNQEVKKVQNFANRILHTNLKEDGILGPKTKQAIKQLQKKAGMHQDGYPDYQLLNKINTYNGKTGFNVPPQPRKKIKSNNINKD